MSGGPIPGKGADMTGIEARFRLDWPGFLLDVDLSLPLSGVSALYGASGSGKTTLLRCIAGLERAPAGRLFVNGEVWQDEGCWVPPHKRPLGYVFQEASLFPHLTVIDNLLYGMRRVHDAPRVSLRQAIELLGIGHLLGRKPDRLSGGERQRAAIARALAVSPRLLLMDEPLASLDEPRKLEIMPYLEALRDEARIPIVYVSHSVAEVARLSDTLVILEAGRVRACGPTVELMQRLDLVPAAGTGEAGALIEARVEAHDDAYGLTTLVSRGGTWRVPRLEAAAGKTVRMQIKARDVMIALERPGAMSALNVIEAVVAEIGPMDAPGVEIRLDAKGEALVARLTRYSAERLALRVGTPVFAVVKSVSFGRESLGATWRNIRAADAGAGRV